MSVLRRLVERRSAGSGWDSIAQLLELQRGGRTRSGVPVDDDQALRLSAVWACEDLVSELVSTLPVDEYRRAVSGEAVPLPQPPLLIDPAGDGSGFEVWCRQVMASLLMRGNAYGLIAQLGRDGWPSQLEVLHPDRVEARRPFNGGPVTWLLDRKPIERWPLGPLWHVPAYCFPGSPVGLSPIRYAAETIGLGIATQRFGADWFDDGAHPTSVYESDHPIDQTQAAVIKERIIAATTNNREPLVLGAGGKLNSIQVNPEESQFLETIQANVADVARFFRVPPEAIGGKAADNLTYANQEERGIALLTYTIGPWLVRLERALTRIRPQPRYVKFNPDALLRVDLQTRYQAHDTAIRGGWRSVNDVRKLEDEAPIPNGNQYLWPPYTTSNPAAAPAPANSGGSNV